jgi:hypothetical protein
MRIQDRSVPKAATLGGGLVVAALGLAPAHGVTQATVGCTLTGRPVVVDLDDVKHRHILDHAFDARRKGQAACPTHPPLRGISESPRIAAGHPNQARL